MPDTLESRSLLIAGSPLTDHDRLQSRSLIVTGDPLLVGVNIMLSRPLVIDGGGLTITYSGGEEAHQSRRLIIGGAPLEVSGYPAGSVQHGNNGGLIIARIPAELLWMKRAEQHATVSLTITGGDLRSRVKNTIEFPTASASTADGLLVPTTYVFSPPAEPVTHTRPISGPGVTRLWLSVAGNAALNLDYSNITDTDAEQLLDAWDAAGGTRDPVVLAATLFPDASPAFQDVLLLVGLGLVWKFAVKPKVVFGSPGRCTVSVELVAKKLYRSSEIGGGDTPTPVVPVEEQYEDLWVFSGGGAVNPSLCSFGPE